MSSNSQVKPNNNALFTTISKHQSDQINSIQLMQFFQLEPYLILINNLTHLVNSLIRSNVTRNAQVITYWNNKSLNLDLFKGHSLDVKYHFKYSEDILNALEMESIKISDKGNQKEQRLTIADFKVEKAWSANHPSYTKDYDSFLQYINGIPQKVLGNSDNDKDGRDQFESDFEEYVFKYKKKLDDYQRQNGIVDTDKVLLDKKATLIKQLWNFLVNSWSKEIPNPNPFDALHQVTSSLLHLDNLSALPDDQKSQIDDWYTNIINASYYTIDNKQFEKTEYLKNIILALIDTLNYISHLEPSLDLKKFLLQQYDLTSYVKLYDLLPSDFQKLILNTLTTSQTKPGIKFDKLLGVKNFEQILEFVCDWILHNYTIYEKQIHSGTTNDLSNFRIYVDGTYKSGVKDQLRIILQSYSKYPYLLNSKIDKLTLTNDSLSNIITKLNNKLKNSIDSTDSSGKYRYSESYVLSSMYPNGNNITRDKSFLLKGNDFIIDHSKDEWEILEINDKIDIKTTLDLSLLPESSMLKDGKYHSKEYIQKIYENPQQYLSDTEYKKYRTTRSRFDNYLASLSDKTGEELTEFINSLWQTLSRSIRDIVEKRQFIVFLDRGNGGTGKSTFHNVIKRLLSQKNTVTIDWNDLHTKDFHKSTLVGTTIAFVDEMSGVNFKDESKIKNMTNESNSFISNVKFTQLSKEELFTTLLINNNGILKIDPKVSDAIYDRFFYIPWNPSFIKEKSSVKTQTDIENYLFEFDYWARFYMIQNVINIKVKAKNIAHSSKLFGWLVNDQLQVETKAANNLGYEYMFSQKTITPAIVKEINNDLLKEYEHYGYVNGQRIFTQEGKKVFFRYKINGLGYGTIIELFKSHKEEFSSRSTLDSEIFSFQDLLLKSLNMTKVPYTDKDQMNSVAYRLIYLPWVKQWVDKMVNFKNLEDIKVIITKVEFGSVLTHKEVNKLNDFLKKSNLSAAKLEKIKDSKENKEVIEKGEKLESNTPNNK